MLRSSSKTARRAGLAGTDSVSVLAGDVSVIAVPGLVLAGSGPGLADPGFVLADSVPVLADTGLVLAGSVPVLADPGFWFADTVSAKQLPGDNDNATASSIGKCSLNTLCNLSGKVRFSRASKLNQLLPTSRALNVSALGAINVIASQALV